MIEELPLEARARTVDVGRGADDCGALQAGESSTGAGGVSAAEE